MLLIYNLSGLLLGVAGIIVGFFLLALTDQFGFAFLGAALTWLLFGGRRRPDEFGQRRPAPSLFFIPLRYWGIPLALLAVPVFVVQFVGDRKPKDTRAALLNADERALRSAAVSGDRALAVAVQAHLALSAVEEISAEQFHVFARLRNGIDGQSALILVRAENLRQFPEPVRAQLLDTIAEAAAEDHPHAKLYIGVKGRISFGAIRTPLGGTQTGKVVSEEPLYDFYRPASSGGAAASQPLTSTPVSTAPSTNPSTEAPSLR